MFNKYVLTLLLPYLHAQASIYNFDLVLIPSQEYVQYNDGYIRGPGSIDLGDLTFTAISEAFADEYEEYIGDDDDEYRNRRLHETTTHQRRLDGGVEHEAFYVDIAIFPLPSSCAHSRDGCDWSSLGVGKRTSDGELRWCCSEESVNLGLCTDSEDNLGRIMIDDKKFKGERRFLSVPKEGPMTKHIRYGEVNVKKSGTYVVLYANCNEEGREISIKGQSIWKSKHGFLPGELFGFMYFYTFITLVYAACFGWFAYLMQIHKQTRIEIEKWIILAIGLGLLEMTFRSFDYYVWNASGVRSPFIIWLGIIIGVLKQGMSRCLAVMVSMGWGISRGSLSGTARTMSIGLAVAYIGISAVSDELIVFAVENISTLSYAEEKTIISVVNVLEFLSHIVNIIFTVWIIHALNKTTKYLEFNTEKKKLIRMLQLLNIFTCATLFSMAWMLFSVFDRYKEEGIVAEEHAWAKDAASEVNYLFVLIGIAILWRPNESAQQYAYFKQLSPLGDDDDNMDEHEMSGIGVRNMTA